MSKGIVFLDRDGTINIDSGYVTRPEDLKLIQGAAQALGLLKTAGFFIAVVSNQSAVGRGMATIEDVEETNKRLRELISLEDARAKIDLISYSIDHPNKASARRKPGIQMFEEIQSMHPCPVESCWMVGDKWTDVLFGLNAGLPKSQCILLSSGQGKKEFESLEEEAKKDLVYCCDLSEAVQEITRA